MQDARVGRDLQRFVSVRYDADLAQGKSLAERYAVRGYPAFVILDANGAKVDEFAGYRTPEEFRNRLHLRSGLR